MKLRAYRVYLRGAPGTYVDVKCLEYFPMEIKTRAIAAGDTFTYRNWSRLRIRRIDPGGG